VTLFKECPGSQRIKEPFPEEIKCICAEMVEIWSDEVSAVCANCKKRLSRPLPPSCIYWCSMAKECIGTKKYEKIIKLRAKQNG
jgi:hypothetical protein